MTDPDFIYDPNNWEVTYDWGDRSEAIANSCDLAPGDVFEFATLCRGPRKWVVLVATSFDEDGCPDETEHVWFDSEDEAKVAAVDVRKTIHPLTGPVSGRTAPNTDATTNQTADAAQGERK